MSFSDLTAVLGELNTLPPVWQFLALAWSGFVFVYGSAMTGARVGRLTLAGIRGGWRLGSTAAAWARSPSATTLLREEIAALRKDLK